MPGYPAGVPTPYAMHVNPYPTRFHGGIWSRPTFDFPVAPTPSTVFLPPRDIEMIPDKPYSGLGSAGADAGGTSRYDVGEGIFRPGGYGGGVFDGNLAGAPPLGQKTKRGIGALAQAMGAVPATATAEDIASYPYGKYSAQTLQLQNALNPILMKYGICPLIADGKLGPLTCGAGIAIITAGGIGDPAIQSLKVLMPTTCESASVPRKPTDPGGCGTGPSAPVPVTPAQRAQVASASAALPGISSNTKKALGFVAGGLAAIGVVYYVKRRRGSRK